MAFFGTAQENTILTIINGGSVYAESISPRDVTASGSISVPAGELLPLTVQEADGAPINTETHVLLFPNASVISSGNQVEVIFPNASSGTIIGPLSSTDNALVRWDGTAGVAIQDSNAILDDDGNLVLTSGLVVGTDATVTGDVSATSGIFSADLFADNGTLTGDLSAVNGAFSADVSAVRVLMGVVTHAGTYAEMIDSDRYVMTAADATVVLPAAPVIGQVHLFKDAAGTASVTNPTIILASGSTIDGQAGILLQNNFAGVSVLWTGSEWIAF